MGRNALLTVALTALVVLAGCAGTGGPAGTDGDANEPKTITVGATGQVQAEADQAVIRVAVEATGPDAPTARQRLAENVSRMRSALSEIGIGEDQVVTAHYDIDQRRQEPRPGGEERPETEYRAIHAFEITLTETDRVGEVIDTAVTNGATSVDSVAFTLSREARQQLRQEALGKAMENARGQATTLASASNLTITGVHTVSTTEVGVHPYREELAFAAGDAGGGTSIESGPVRVTAQVAVVYNASAA